MENKEGELTAAMVRAALDIITNGDNRSMLRCRRSPSQRTSRSSSSNSSTSKISNSRITSLLLWWVRVSLATRLSKTDRQYMHGGRWWARFSAQVWNDVSTSRSTRAEQTVERL